MKIAPKSHANPFEKTFSRFTTGKYNFYVQQQPTMIIHSNNDCYTCRSLMNNCSRNQLTSKSSSFMNSNHRREQFFNGVTKRRRPKALSSSASCHSHGSQKQRRQSRPHIDCLQILDLNLNKQVLYIVPHAPPSTPLRSNSSSTPTSLNSVVNFNSTNNTTPTTNTNTTTSSTNTMTCTSASTSASSSTTNSPIITTNESISTSSCTSFSNINRPPQNHLNDTDDDEISPITFNSVVIHGSLYQSDTMAPLNSNEFIIDNYNRIDPKPELNSRLSDHSSTISSNSQLDSPLSDITEWNLDMSGSMFDILFIETDF